MEVNDEDAPTKKGADGPHLSEVRLHRVPGLPGILLVG